MRKIIPLLEMHAAHACNLTCESCSHFSNNGHKGFLQPEEADAWMQMWNRRLRPQRFRILGGEPTLNPRLPELIELAAQRWRKSQIALTTNGFFLHRHPTLPMILSRHRVRLSLSIHHAGPDYRAKVQEIVTLIAEWRRHFPFPLAIEETYIRWTRRYRGFAGAVLPFEDGDPRKSWENCCCRNTVQLFRGRLWKCSPIAYLRLQKETYPDISPKWDPYLNYDGLSPDCSRRELHAFFAQEDEPICGMCSTNPEHFEKPSPLIPLGVRKKSA